MLSSIKKAFQSKAFTIAFLCCFALATPIFVKAIIIDMDAGKMDLVHWIALSLQYLFCVVVMPQRMSEKFTE